MKAKTRHWSTWSPAWGRCPTAAGPRWTGSAWLARTLPAPAVPQLARVCPGLLGIGCEALGGEELAEALEVLATVVGTLKVLSLTVVDGDGIELPRCRR